VHEGMSVGDRYRLEHLLGQGGLGEVWEAADLTLERRVAIKFVTGVVQYPQAARRFEREARTLAALHHGGVVTVHDAGTIDHEGRPLPYLVMERLHGATWETAAAGSVVDTGARLADALAHVHDARILHRDVKLANIMICADGRVVLMDFGIARDDASTTRTLTAAGMGFGTPAYMAPEQIRGQGATPASDVYALGLVLVEKLTGHRLPAEQLTSQVAAAIPPHTRATLVRMTATRPEQRPTAAECAELLRTPAKSVRTADPTLDTTLQRLAPPAVLLALFALSLFLPAYPTWSVRQSLGEQGGGLGLGVFVGLATTLVMTAALTPDDRAAPRLTGYAGATLALGCLLWLGSTGPPFYHYNYASADMQIRFGMWFFYLTTALTIAVYVHREFRTRGTTAPTPERLVVPAMLLTLFAITLLQPAYLGYGDRHRSVARIVVGNGLTGIILLVGLATTLVATAILVRDSGMSTRLTG
jgi:hypothetical protein